MGFGVEIGHGASGLDTSSGTRAVSVSETADPLPLTVEPAEIGSAAPSDMATATATLRSGRPGAVQLGRGRDQAQGGGQSAAGLLGGEVSRGRGGGLQLTSLDLSTTCLGPLY